MSYQHAIFQGIANGTISDETWVRGWMAFAAALQEDVDKAVSQSS